MRGDAFARRDRRAALAATEERHLADDVAWAQLRDLLAPQEYPRTSGEQDVARVGRFTLRDEWPTGRQDGASARVGQRFDVVLRTSLERRKVAQLLDELALFLV